MGIEVNGRQRDTEDGYKPGYGYTENYYGQEPNGRDGYGNPTYERQKPNHWGEMPTDYDGYGNPIYGTK